MWAKQGTIRNTLPLLAIVALGGFLRVYRIGSQGLWIDEAFSIWLGSQPLGEMLRWVVRVDQHPPLYYTLLHLWLALGDDEATVRALSALFGTLTIPVAYLLGRRLADKKVGLLTALILAVSPFHVRFAQEARMYTLLMLNGSLALYALVHLLTDPRATREPLGRQLVDLWRAWRATRCKPSPETVRTDLAWLGYVLFTAATLLTHNTAAFFAFAANLVVFILLLVTRRPRIAPSAPPHPFRRNWLLAQLAVLLLWSPWLPAFVNQSVGVYQEFWLPTPTWETVVGAVGAFVSDSLPWSPAGACAVGTVYAGLAALGLLHFRHRPAHVALLLVFFATPLVGEWLVSLWQPIFYTRTLIWASLPLYVLLAAGVRQLRRWPYVLAAVMMMLTVNSASLRDYYVNFEKEQWDKAAALVAERVEPGDLILFNAAWGQIPFDYYFHQQSAQPVAEHGVPVDLFDAGVLEPTTTADDLPRVRTLVQDRERVWLIYSHDWYADPLGLIPPALEGELDLRDLYRFRGVQVRLYERK